MSYVIDRRLNGKNKSTVNRQRFLRRYRDHIKKAVEEAVSRRSITDMEHGEQISIPGRDIDEPVLHHGRGGKQTVVHPGNKEFTSGEHIPRPQGGGGGKGPGKAGNSGEGMDEFVFQITQEEFLEFMFEDLELPNLVKRNLTGTDTFKTVRAGISNEGNPSRINIIRTLRSAHARRIALSGSSRAKLREAKEELARLKCEEPDNFGDIQDLEAEIEKLSARIHRVPFLDTFDLKYNLLVKQPNPSSKAVMFCLMDVSGSMTQATKDIAKRFFHPVVPVPETKLRQDRCGLHSPPHQRPRSGRRGVLLLQGNRWHHRFQRVEADAGNHGRTLPRQRMEHLCGPGVGRR